MITISLSRIRRFFTGLFLRGRHGGLSPRRDWAILCIVFAVLAAAVLFYSAVLFARAGYAGMAPAPKDKAISHVQTIDRNRLGEAVAAFERLQATFDQTTSASSTFPRPE